MEDFFKEMFYDVQSVKGPGRRGAADLYGEMVTLYASVLRRTTNWIGSDRRTGGPIGKLIAAAANHPALTILTFNHDLVVENELMKRSRLKERWCVPDGYGTFGSRLQVTNPTGGRSALMRVHTGADCDHSDSIKLLKLHGSLNWYVRLRTKKPPISVLLGETATRAGMTSRRQIAAQVTFTRAGRGRTQWTTWPVIVPPVYGKQMAITGFLADVWRDASDAVAAADRLVIVGYSLPPTDVEAEKMFQRALLQNRELRFIEVVNPDPAAAARYASLAPRPLRWFPDLGSYIDSEWWHQTDPHRTV
jgi:hypothetical protein